jgi:TonB-dependent SusC/RagA subfamily outer membrane receptor
MFRSFCSLTMRAGVVLAMASLVGAPGLSAQGGTITGRVTDTGTGEPIPLAQIFIADLDAGSLTQANGTYLLVNIPAGTRTLTVQRLGFREVTATVQVTAGQTVVQDFLITQAAIQLEEVIVTGTAGGTRRRALGNTVARIDATALAVRPVTRIEEAVGGGIPGVRFMRPAAAAGGTSEIRIRSSNSLSLSLGPLIYVDGIRINTDREFASRASATSRLQDIDPNSIESIEIIKGPAAATLYGTEASNGVIQIITKKGIEGETVFEVSTEVGANWQPHPSDNFGLHWYTDPDTDQIVNHNMYEMLKQPAYLGRDLLQYGQIKRFNISARGGSSVFRYYAGLSRDDTQGFTDINYTESWNAQASISIIPSPDLSFTLNASRLAGSTRDAGGLMCSLDCFARPIRDRKVLGDGGAADFYLSQRDGETDIRFRNRSGWSANLTHSPTSLPWFSQRITGGVDDSGIKREYFVPLGGNGYGVPGVNRLGSNGREGDRNIWDISTKTRTVDYSATASFAVTDQLNSATSVGLQYFEEDRTELNLHGENFSVAALATVSGANDISASEDFLENVTVGMFVQNEFSWADRIFVTGAVRFDDNSAFGTNFDAAVYPKLMGSWVLSEEEFWQSPLGLNQLRLRGAWGMSGQQPDAFAASRLYTPITGPGQGALTPMAIGNPDLGPEIGQELEVGFDASLMDDRLGLEFTWYNRVTKDAIVAAPVRPSIGFPGVQLVNIGQTSSWGTETSVNLQVLTQDPVRWDLNLSFASMGNKIDDMGGLDALLVTALMGGMNARGQFHVEGYPIAGLFEKEVVSADFVSGTSGAVTNVMCDDGKGIAGREMGGPAVPCADADQVYFGPGDPTWQVSLGSTWTLFEDWRLAVRFDALGGNWVNGDYIAGQNTRHAEKTIKKDDAIWNGFMEETRDGVTMYRGDFLKLREVSLRYALPASVAGLLGASSASMVGSLYNIATLWARDRETRFGQYIWDQEMTAPNFEYQGQVPGGTPPPMSRATLRMNFTF